MNFDLKIVGEGNASAFEFNVRVLFIALHKSYLVLVSDQEEFGIGTVTLSSPPTLEGTNAMSAPALLFGLKNDMLANMIGKISSQKLKQPILSLIFIKEQNLKPEIIMKTTMDAVLMAIDQVLNIDR